jgi:voltage-gated potassium channel
VLIGVGVVSFVSLEQKSFVDALWLILISMTTVGYGDVVPATTTGRVIIMLLVLSGVGLLTYVLSTIFVGIVEGHISDIWGKRKMMKEISKLKDHIIVCGAGRVGNEVIAELIREEHDFVVIEKDPNILNELHEEGTVKFIAGNASEDKVLLAARVAHASGVITTLADDAENLMITIACRDFNPKVRIVARANRPESVIRLKRAGADTVVSPSAIAGSRMALDLSARPVWLLCRPLLRRRILTWIWRNCSLKTIPY